MTSKPSSGRFWMAVPFLLLGTSVTGWLIMVQVAVSDPGFAVEPDYYKKASSYDDVVLQRAKNRGLGWNAEVTQFSKEDLGRSQLIMRVRDKKGELLKGATVKVEAFPIARSADRQELPLSEREGGTYATELSRPRVGLWEIRVTAEKAGSIFTQSLRAELFELTKPEGSRTPS